MKTTDGIVTPPGSAMGSLSSDSHSNKTRPAIEFAKQAEKLAQYTVDQETEETGSTQAVEAKFVTPQDPIIITVDGARLPSVPREEAIKLNRLKAELEGRDPNHSTPAFSVAREAKDGAIHGIRPPEEQDQEQDSSEGVDEPLSRAIPPSKTNPLFPPLPMWGPPTLMRNLQSRIFRISAAVLSFCFLLTIILGALFTCVPKLLHGFSMRFRGQDPAKLRPFYEEERRLQRDRRAKEREWKLEHAKIRRSQLREKSVTEDKEQVASNSLPSFGDEKFKATDGGPDPLVCDVAYYARRVGLDCETFWVETEDGFIIELWHLFNPLTSRKAQSADFKPEFLPGESSSEGELPEEGGRYPVLLIHGLLQSSGAYCCTDENSLAFFLAKSGLDVWLGNNRCGFKPRHSHLKPTDSRIWAWNIRQMGVLDLPALISRVLHETGFSQLALVAHSQGTTQTLVALAKEQRPEIGDLISVVCLLAPAAYAGPLIGKMYFKFMRVISPAMFRAMFGIHAFIPFMMKMHKLLPGKFYGFMGYRVFSFLFNWTDQRWDRELRDRCFQFAPVYVSAESMRWWLGRECFARHKCILSTKQESQMENEEDLEDDEVCEDGDLDNMEITKSKDRGRFSWYDEHVPPLALWVAGSDDLVDGKRLLRRFERGREPFVEIVHQSVIEEYEHLDVIWAIDSIEKVGKGVLETIWKTVPDQYRNVCRTPVGCEEVKAWKGRRSRTVEKDSAAEEGLRQDTHR
ncbi:alpha/beta-hydrolase [Tothia fuscella]|uniref:Alpha/beta-hydrolase n=1 Tax=Tothia fuscella TaxID=1048955 RepID=A0A9P4P376_9PEZI|nr:alpha/beta-hydrolase [Tothia fuscella]